MTIEAAIADFLLACEADGLRIATIKWYRSLLVMFMTMYQGMALVDITTKMIRKYIVSLRQRDKHYIGRGLREGGLSEESIAGHIRALHRFWKWVQREYRLDFNPMANIKRPRQQIPEPKGIDMDDLARLFAATGDDVRGQRDKALLAFLIDTGTRSQGLLSLTDAKLNIAERQAMVQEKAAPRRLIFFSEFTAQLLTSWLAVRPANAKTIFCSLSHNYRWSGAPLSSNGLYMLLKRLKKASGVSGRVNPHSFRHGFAREYIKNGGDLATLARHMGHSSVTTTASYYAVFSPGELATSHDKFSPIDSIKTESEEQ